MTKRSKLLKAEMALRDFALAFPDAVEDFPWGHRAAKVKGKIFFIIGFFEDKLGVTVKLPVTGKEALALPFAEPTGYGLGKSGWVSARFGPKDAVPLEMLREWIDESFRAVAPKRVLARLESEEEGADDAKTKTRPPKRSAK